MVMCRELAPQKGWCCYTFWFHDVIILSYLLKYISYPHKLGILLKLNYYATCLSSGISVDYKEVEIQRFEEYRLGVVPEAVPPVQTLWQIAVLRANFAKTLIFLPKLVSTQIWYQMIAYIYTGWPRNNGTVDFQDFALINSYFLRLVG